MPTYSARTIYLSTYDGYLCEFLKLYIVFLLLDSLSFNLLSLQRGLTRKDFETAISWVAHFPALLSSNKHKKN